MLKLTSKPARICEVEDYVKALAKRYNIGADLYPNILISLTEAVNNAILHGNSSDETKAVRIELVKKQDLIAFSVTDEGDGFDVNELPDPTAPENLHKCGGRGVFLMRELCDEIQFKQGGSKVVLRFKL